MNELNWYDIALIIFFMVIIIWLASNNKNKPTNGTATT